MLKHIGKLYHVVRRSMSQYSVMQVKISVLADNVCNVILEETIHVDMYDAGEEPQTIIQRDNCRELMRAVAAMAVTRYADQRVGIWWWRADYGVETTEGQRGQFPRTDLGRMLQI